MKGNKLLSCSLRGESGDGKNGSKVYEGGREIEWRLPFISCTDDLVLCGESEEDLNVMVGHFVEVYRRSLKVNVDKS